MSKPEPVRMTLTWAELMICAMIGSIRRIKTLNSKKFRDLTKSPWEVDIEAVCAEFCLAKHLNKFWAEMMKENFHDGDIDGKEVRHTKEKNGHLIIYDTDNEERPAVLVVGSSGVYWLIGWRLVKECRDLGKVKLSEESNTGKQEWWVKQEHLLPMRDLK